jgi:hypothetical protein
LDVREQVARQEDGLAARLELEDEVLHVAGRDRVEARSRLVEEDDLGVVDERLGEADAAHHALGVLPDLALAGVLHPEAGDEVVDPLPAGRAVDVEEPGVEIEGLVRVQEAVEIGLLGQEPDARLGGDVGGGAAEDAGRARAGEEEAEEELHRGGLARPVRADEAEDLAGVDLEIETVERLQAGAPPEILVDLGEALRLDDVLHGIPEYSTRP